MSHQGTRARPPAKRFDELDAFTRWRRLFHWHGGILRRIKRRANKAARRAAKQEVKEGAES